MGDIVKYRLPCLNPECGSSDARQMYKDGTSFCFSCRTPFPAGVDTNLDFNKMNQSENRPKRTIEDIRSYHTRSLEDRKISKNICEYFGVKVSYSGDGKIDAHYYPYGDNSYKVRKLPKIFSWVNSSKGLFGKELFTSGGNRLIITEGEIDALSIAEASFKKYGKIYPVVSLSSSAMTNSLLLERDWIRSFKEVVLCFDMDDAGTKATSEAIKIIGFDKVKIAKLPFNDPNEILCKKGYMTLLETIWNAEKYKPSNIVGRDQLWEALKEYNNVTSLPFPECLAGLNEKLKGMRPHEIALYVSGTGAGKSSLIREIIYHIIKTTDAKVGIVALEESPAETTRKLSGLPINRNPNKEEIPLEDLKEGFDIIFGEDRVMVLDHQGSINDGSIIDNIEFMVLSGCEYVFIDHITILVSEGIENLSGNEAQDKMMNNLLRSVKRHPFHLGLVSHLRKTSGQGQSFEEGKMPSLDDIRGCLAYDTEVLSYEGYPIPVQDVKVGHELMGPDETPRKVLKLFRGTQQMYKVINKTSGNYYVCNEDHFLTLSHNNKIFDMRVKDFLKRSASFQYRCKQCYSQGYELPEIPVSIPPYSLGAWLGDGSKSAFRIMDTSNLKIAERVASEINATLKRPSNTKREYFSFDTGTKGEMIEKLRKTNLLNNKHIPYEYIFNSKQVRYELLAGLLDTDGSYSERDQAYYFYQKDKELVEAVQFIARSLGFYSTINKRLINGSYKGSNGTVIWELSISGNIFEIPSQKGLYINFRPRKTDHLKRGIIIEKLEEGDYYGFLLDKDGRYLLGNHIITHNSGSVKQISFDVIAFSRNMVADSNLEKNTINMRVLKSRFTGLTGNVPGAIYDYDTGRLKPFKKAITFTKLE